MSAALLRYGSDYYPMSRYAEVFMKLEGGSRGVVTMSQLSVLLLSLNQEIDDDYLGELKQELDRGDGLLLFDDFTDLMDRLIDSQAELEVLGKLEDKGRLLRIELAALLARIIILPVFIVFDVLFKFVNMIIDVYLMADSFHDGSQLTKRVESFVGTFSAFFNNLKPLPLFHLIPPLKLSFDIIVVFTLPIPVEGGVSCTGMQAPMYLFLNYLVICFVLVLFDTSVFLFLRMSPEDLKLPEAKWLTRCGLPATLSRTIEQAVAQVCIVGAGRNVKTLIQLVMAKMVRYIVWCFMCFFIVIHGVVECCL